MDRVWILRPAASRAATVALALALAACAAHRPASGRESIDLVRQVADAERAFAKTMADRDLAAFSTFIAEEAVFFGKRTLHGKQQIVDGWKSFYQDPVAPFSWTPEQVEVLPSGKLGFSSGPVLDGGGKRIGTFNSVWRRDPDGKWRVVFDKGCPVCDGKACKLHGLGVCNSTIARAVNVTDRTVAKALFRRE